MLVTRRLVASLTYSLARSHTRAQVTGLDVQQTRNHDEMWELCLAHYKALRADPCLSESRIVFLAECNLAGEGRELCKRMIRLPNVAIACDKINDYGFKTTAQVKPQYVTRFIARLETHDVLYHEKLIVANPFRLLSTAAGARGGGGGGGLGGRPNAATSALPLADLIRETRREFELEMSRFAIHYRPPLGLSNREASVTFSGKYDAHGKFTAQMRDDMVMAMIMCHLWSARAIANYMTLRDSSRALSEFGAREIGET